MGRWLHQHKRTVEKIYHLQVELHRNRDRRFKLLDKSNRKNLTVRLQLKVPTSCSVNLKVQGGQLEAILKQRLKDMSTTLSFKGLQ